jgi:hypothetical protein
MQRTAERLDMLQNQLVNIYAQRTGMTPEELNPLLDAETWMTAQEALALKFIDQIVGTTTATNLLDATNFGFQKVPDHPLIAKAASSPAPAATLQTPENIMDPTIDPATGLPIAPPIVTPPAPVLVPEQPTNVADVATAAANAAVAAERARASTIRNEATRARLSADFADTLVNEGITIDVARTRIIDAIAQGQHAITNIAPALIPAEQFRARSDAMALAIAHRANPRNELTEEARAFAGRRLIVLARDFLEATGVNTRNLGDVEVAQQVFRNRGPVNAGQHTSGDFPALLANTVGRTLRRSYELAPQTFQSFCRQASVPDFRPVSRVALSDITAMQQVAQGAEYSYATVGDSAETYTVGKWGQIISLTWETIINDDLSAFDRLPMAMGQEAAQVESDLVYAILISNPNMADSVALFHATHGNLAASGTAISIASLQTGRTAMRTQKGPKGRFLNVTPATLVVGPLKEGEANQFTSANFVAAKSSDINPEYNRSLSVTVEPRITDLSWFLASDPNAQPIDTIEYAYLAGHEGLQVDQRQGFEVDGVDIKARIVVGAKAIDYRGLYKNPGA